MLLGSEICQPMIYMQKHKPWSLARPCIPAESIFHGSKWLTVQSKRHGCQHPASASHCTWIDEDWSAWVQHDACTLVQDSILHLASRPIQYQHTHAAGSSLNWQLLNATCPSQELAVSGHRCIVKHCTGRHVHILAEVPASSRGLGPQGLSNQVRLCLND